MAFWGVYLKPNEPYTLQCDNDDDAAAPKRLRITQATLGDATRNSPARSIVRCSVGEKPAIAICSLSVKELTCCQLELEFEESHDVVFSVMGPRGVFLAGYLITPAPTTQQYSIDHKGQEKTTVEIAGRGDYDLHTDELDLNKTGTWDELDLNKSVPVKELIIAQNMNIEDSGKKIKDRNRLLKCTKDRNRKEQSTITLEHKTRKDGNKDSSFCTHEKDEEKTIAVRLHTVFGRLLEEKSDAIGKKKKKKSKKSRKGKPNSLVANDLLDQKFGSSSVISEENKSDDACEISHENVKKRKRKHKRSKDLVNA